MPIKINTSFLFKNTNSSEKPVNASKIKNTTVSDEDDSSSCFHESFKDRGTKRKRFLYETTDKTSSGDDLSSESEVDEEDSPPSSPEFTEQMNISPVIENAALKQREDNIKARDAFLISFMSDPEFAEAVQNVGLFNKNNEPSYNSSIKRKSIKIKRRAVSDGNFRTSCQVPLESRKSLRLQCRNPQFSHEDLPDESNFASVTKRNNYDSDGNLDDLEEIVYEPKNKRTSTRRHIEKTFFLSVEDVTDSMLENIARRVVDKEYSQVNGTSCHQCRQKTKDTKTFCRAQDCGGVRGQFCGVCLLNRYGEDAAVALKDPNWHCPPCRGICNCSFCRAREGKRPTGILVPTALKAGHKSVKEFLDSLRGKGDYIDPHLDPKKLLGFTNDLEYAQMGGDRKEFIGSFNNFTKFQEIIESFTNKLLGDNGENESGDCTDSTKDLEELLGFTKDLNYAVMGGNRNSYIGSHTLSYEH